MVNKLKAIFVILFAGLAIGAFPSSGSFFGKNHYFVNATGNDSNSGTSPLRPWKTIGKVNGFSFPSGSIVSFHGGDTFSGGLTNFVTGMTITSYGVGQPTISSGNSTACATITNVGGVTINNIICQGGGNLTNSTVGIFFHNTSGASFVGATVTNSTITGYGSNCLQIGEYFTIPSFSSVVVSNNSLHDCTGNHIVTTEITGCVFAGFTINTTVSGNTVFNCPGTPGNGGSTNWTGGGLIVDSATNVSITHNLVHDAGSLNNFAGAGPVGIQAFGDNGVLVAFNEVYHIRTNGGDGEGLDVSSSDNEIIEYNYIHDANFTDIILGTFSQDNSNLTIRFNITEAGPLGELAIHSSCGAAGCINWNIYNNTFVGGGVIIGPNNPGNPFSANFSNNILIGPGPVTEQLSFGTNAPTSLNITGNDYSNSTINVTVAGTTYTTLAALQAAGFEKVAGNPVGTTANPNLVGTIGSGGNCSGGGLNSTCPAAYKVTTSSPAGSPNGLNINTLYNCTVGGQDFYGNVITASTLPIGANFGPGATAGGVPDGSACPVPYVGIGDAVASANFYVGLRAYSFATVGNKAVNLRRSSDNHTCDINTTNSQFPPGTGVLGNTANCSTGGDNGQSVASFCNATSCFATELYDQTGNGFNFIQSTAAAQPQFILSCINSLPCLQFTAGTTFMSSTTKVASFPYSVGLTAERTGNITNDNDYLSFAGNGTTGHDTLSSNNFANSIAFFTGGSGAAVGTANDNVWHAFGGTTGATANLVVYADGVAATSGASSVLFTTNGPVLGGDANGSPASDFTGNLTEAFGYSSLLSGTSETLLCKNSQNYYNAANFGGIC